MRTERFYAYVLEIRDNSLLVEGIPENDVNHRSKYYISMKDENSKKTILDKDGWAIGFADIPTGSLVRIEYDGIVLESFPGRIEGAIMIQIVEYSR
jgi:hypothetical protein